MSARPKILVTNDDGVQAPGLRRLAAALARAGTVWVVAPDRERNAASHALTLHKPLRAEPVAPRVLACSGTPTDCVNLAVNRLLDGPPALIVSGINQGANLGPDVTYSGTVAAAIEGTILGIPSVAISQAGHEEPLTSVDGRDFAAAAAFAVQLARLVLSRGLPPGVFLNVNVPNRSAARMQAVRITTLGRRIFDRDTIITKVDPRGRRYYWVGENRIAWQDQKDADYYAVEEGLISVTPLHLDLTQHQALERLREWETLLRPRPRSGTRRHARV